MKTETINILSEEFETPTHLLELEETNRQVQRNEKHKNL